MGATKVNISQNFRSLIWIAIFSAALAFVLPRAIPFVRIAEYWLHDFRIGFLTPPKPVHSDIILVTVTEDTLATLPFRSPLDRRFFGDVVSQLVEKEVRAIGIDYIFDQATAPEDDLYLKTVFATSPVPIIVGKAASQTWLTKSQRAYQKQFLNGLKPAFVNVISDEDGVVRYAYRGQRDDAEWEPGLADGVAEAVGLNISRETGPIAFYPSKTGEKIYQAFKSFPAHTVKFLPKAWFKNKVVLFGADLTMDDRLLTPFARTTGGIPGLYVHAYALAQIMDGHRVKSSPTYVQMALVALMAGIGVVLSAVPWPLLLRAGVLAGVLAGYWLVGIGLYRYGSHMVPLVSPTFAVMFGWGVSTAILGYRERQQKQFLRGAFSKYVSANLVQDIIENPEQLGLEGSRRYLTFVFTDLAGFTTLAEQLDPGDLVDLLNGYIEGMCATAFSHGGTVDKIVGDAVVVYWGAPVEQEDQRGRAVACALEMDAFAEDYRKRHPTRAGQLGMTRIGINSGFAIVGNFGGETFFDYTAHGDMVNTAARLEGANKYLGTRICVGQETRDGCPAHMFRPVAGLILKGKTEPIQVFEPVTEAVMSAVDLVRYERCYELMRAKDNGALAAFEEMAASLPNDPVCKLHIERLAAGDSGVVITLAGK